MNKKKKLEPIILRPINWSYVDEKEKVLRAGVEKFKNSSISLEKIREISDMQSRRKMPEFQNRLIILKSDPIMKALIAKHGKLTLERGTDYFESLVRSITGQQLSGKAAETIYKRVLALAGGELSADKIVSIPDEALRQAGLSKNKVNYIKNLAAAVIEKTIDFDAISKTDDEEVIRQLTALKGIGRWTAEMFLIFSLAREDLFSLGDGGLNNAINNLYGKGIALTKDEIKVITDKWQPYRSIASLYLWRSLDNK